MYSTYEDKLATDIERIQRAKEVLRSEYSSRRDKVEAMGMIAIYRQVAEEHRGSTNEEERERAEDILYEISR